jgi:serralysin
MPPGIICFAYGQTARHLNVQSGSSSGSTTKIPNIHFDTPIFWKCGQTLRIGFYDGDSFQQIKTKQYAKEWTVWANLEFLFVSEAPYDIYIGFTTPGQNHSLLGTISQRAAGASNPSPSMQLGDVRQGTDEARIRSLVLHEFGHALGLLHEHQNLNNAMSWDYDAVYAAYSHVSKDVVDQNILATTSGRLFRKNKMDKESVMMYEFPSSLLTNGRGTQNNFKLSDMDKACMLYRYPGREKGEFENLFALQTGNGGDIWLEHYPMSGPVIMSDKPPGTTLQDALDDETYQLFGGNGWLTREQALDSKHLLDFERKF